MGAAVDETASNNVWQMKSDSWQTNIIIIVLKQMLWSQESFNL